AYGSVARNPGHADRPPESAGQADVRRIARLNQACLEVASGKNSRLNEPTLWQLAACVVSGRLRWLNPDTTRWTGEANTVLKLQLHWQILLAILLAGLAGWASGTDSGMFG